MQFKVLHLVVFLLNLYDLDSILGLVTHLLVNSIGLVFVDLFLLFLFLDILVGGL